MKQTRENEAISEAVKVVPSILDAFESLRQRSNESVVLLGGVKIISILNENEDEKNLQYVLKRLVRSLGANTPDLRMGYFATLVTLLKNNNGITVAQLSELLKKELHANGSSKSEIGDVALGHILVAGAIFRSGLMMKCSEEEQKYILNLLMNASSKKSYLGTVAYSILLDFAKNLSEENFTAIVWSNIKDHFKKELKEYTLDSLYFLMVMNTKFPNQVKLKKLIGSKDLICEENIDNICEKLMGGIDFNSTSHPVYEEVTTQIANSEHLLQFWNTIDKQLCKHNRNRELVSISMLNNILKKRQDNTEVIPELLTKNFLKLFMDWFKGLQTASKIRNKKDDEDDCKIMIKKENELIATLANVLKSEKVDSKTKVEVLKKLLFYPGEMTFTETTGSTITRSIISDLDFDGIKKMAKMFKGVLLNTSKKYVKENVERSWYNNERLKAAEHISYIVNHEACKSEIKFKLEYMKLLMCFAFFKISGEEEVAVSGDLSGSLKTCFYRCFSSKFQNVDNLVEVLSYLSSFINSMLEKEQIKKKIEKQFPGENMECWKLVSELSSSIKSKSKVDKVFLILLYQLGLFLFSEPNHVEMAKSSIKELKSCYEHYKKGDKKKGSKGVEEIVNDDPEWIEVLVEVLLSIISTESSVLRSIVQCVFRLLWEFLTPSSIGQIVSVLDPDSDTNPLTENSDSEDDDDDNDNTKENDNEDSDESDETVEDEDGEMKIPDQLRIAVQKALGSGAGSDDESIDADMIDEDEGNRLNDALAEAFRQFHTGKGKKSKKDRKDKKALSDFRVRSLDLIDIYLEKDPSMDVCLAMIAPLMRGLEHSLQDGNQDLTNRLRKTLKSLAKVKKFSSTDDVNIDILCDYLKSTVDKGARSHFMYQRLGDVITNAAIFIIHCSQRIDTKPLISLKKKKSVQAPLLALIKEYLQSFFQNRNCLIPVIFFHNILQLEWDGSYDLLQIIIDNVFSQNVRQFKRNEGLELLAGFYRNLKRIKPCSESSLQKLKNFEEHFEDKLKKAFDSESNSFTAKANFFTILQKVIKGMEVFHEHCEVRSCIDFKTLSSFISSSKLNIKIPNSTPGNQNQNGDTKSLGKKNKKKRKTEIPNGNTEPQKKNKIV